MSSETQPVWPADFGKPGPCPSRFILINLLENGNKPKRHVLTAPGLACWERGLGLHSFAGESARSLALYPRGLVGAFLPSDWMLEAFNT